MMTLTDWTGLSGLALVWMLLAMRLPKFTRFPLPNRIVFALVIYCVVMLPVFGLSLAGWLRGQVGDLSITSVLLLAVALIARIHQSADATANGLVNARDRFALLLFVSVLALLLYPFALGIGIVDPYRFGFGSIAFIVVLGLLALWALWRNLSLLTLAISLTMLAWSLGWYESANLWDYLVDVPLAIYALVVTLKSILLNTVRGKRV